MALLIWNGNSFVQRLSIVEGQFSSTLRIAAVALCLNVALILFGWLAQKIVRLLAETGFPAERLVVEVTESSLFADIDLARTIVHSLKNQGIALALDDFGSGFSSLSHLSALPFDKIKIDRSFVASIGKNRQSAAIVRAVTTMAQALDVPVVAEGIEDAAAHETLRQMGCGLGQGWYFGKPMPAEDAKNLLRHRDVIPATALPLTAIERRG